MINKEIIFHVCVYVKNVAEILYIGFDENNSSIISKYTDLKSVDLDGYNLALNWHHRSAI